MARLGCLLLHARMNLPLHNALLHLDLCGHMLQRQQHVAKQTVLQSRCFSSPYGEGLIYALEHWQLLHDT